MASTKIEWADAVWNPITGCTPVSEACENCYAKRMANRLAGRYGYPADDPFRVTFHRERLEDPLKWKKPRRIFVLSMGDIFHSDVPFYLTNEIFEVMRKASNMPGHIFMVLTKRPQRMAEFIELLKRNKGPDFVRWPLPNVWLGVTAENQARADERIHQLLQIPAAVRFVSIEPMLGPVDLREFLKLEICPRCIGGIKTRQAEGWPRCNRCGFQGASMSSLWPEHASVHQRWVICGGETGPGARPMHPDWVRSLRDQCQAAVVPFFFKGWGKWTQNPSAAGKRILDGRECNELPQRYGVV